MMVTFLVVDRDEATNGKVVIVSINGELTVKRLRKAKGRTWLTWKTPTTLPLDFREQMILTYGEWSRMWSIPCDKRCGLQ